jgi:hypothetical protein
MALFPLFLLFEVLSGFTEAWPTCMYPVSPRQQGDPEGECCDLRLLLLRNEAATSEIIPALSIRSSKLIGNQLGLHAVYMASLYPSGIRIIKLPLHYNTGARCLIYICSQSLP